ncbi:hypothetical protein J6590_006861 [Homalodisca vitripennis]|nr:hypothetical protein J6590_006861 [Homalodisca vitripennis]
MYADDCQLHMPFGLNGLEEAIAGVSSELKSIQVLSGIYGHKMNANKCIVLYIALTAQLQSIKENNVQIRIEDEDVRQVHMSEAPSASSTALERLKLCSGVGPSRENSEESAESAP